MTQDKQSDLFLIYLVTKSGYKGNLHMVKTEEDAIAFCNHPLSRGVSRGSQWLLMFTNVNHLMNRDAVYGGELQPFVMRKDTGKQDKVFNDLCIPKMSKVEMETEMKKRGFTLKYV